MTIHVHRAVRIALGVGLATASGACSTTEDTPGSFAVNFLFRGAQPDLDAQPLWIQARVEEWPEGQDDGRELAVSSVLSFRSGVMLDLAEVPNGVNRVVLVELRAAEATDDPVMWFGVSRRFELRPGRHEVVDVRLDPQPAPGAPVVPVDDDPDGGVGDVDGGPGRDPGGALLVVEAPNDGDIVGSPGVTLVVDPAFADAVEVANDVTFSRGQQIREVDTLIDRGAGFFAWPEAWDINAGVCQAPDCADGLRSVYVRFHNSFGYVSEALSATMVLDTTPPEVAAASVTPGIARRGARVVITINPNEALSQAPSLLSDPPLELGEMESLGASWVLTWVPDNSLEDGTTVRFSASLEDLAGNESPEAEAIGELTLDFSPPEIAELSAQPARVSTAAEFNQVSLSFALGEDLLDNEGSLEVAIGATAIDCDRRDAEGIVRCAYPVDGNEPPGEAAVSVAATDAAGNRTIVGTQVVFDFEPPGLLAESVDRALAARDTEVFLTLTPDEALLEAPEVVAIAAAPDVAPIAFPWVEGSQFIFRGAVNAETTDGAYGFQVSLVDAAGNRATVDTQIGFVVDASVPEIGELQTDAPVYSAQPGFNTLNLSFDLSESLDGVGAELSASLGATPMECGPYSAESPSYRCAVAITPDASTGRERIRVIARDAAGNQSERETSVDLDLDAPRVLGESLSADAAGLGEVVFLALTWDELLADVPEVRAIGPGNVDVTWAASAQLFRMEITEDAGDGPYSFEIDATDAYGNTATRTPALTLRTDVSVPEILSFERIDSGDGTYSAQPEFAEVVLAYDLAPSSDAEAPEVLANIGQLAMQCVPDVDTPTRGECRYTLDGNEASGAVSARLRVQDSAGNATSATLPLTFDLAPPRLLGSALGAPLVGAGGRVLLSLTADEALGELPEVETLGEAALVLEHVPGSNFAFERFADPAQHQSGDYSFRITLTDRYGNVATLEPELRLTLDLSTPAIDTLGLVIPKDPPVFSAQPGHSEIAVAFTSDEPLHGPGAIIEASIAGRDMPCELGDAEALRYICRYTLDGSERSGPAPVEVEVVDRAGNERERSLDLVFDLDGPVLLSSALNTQLAGLNQPLSLLLTSNETLAREPRVAVSGPGDVELSYEAQSSFRYSRLITGADASGDYTVAVTMEDLYGNVSELPGVASFTLDTQAPSVIDPTLTPDLSVFSLDPARNHIDLSFFASEPVHGAGAAELEASVGGRPMQCELRDAETLRYGCSYSLVGDEGSGARAIELEVKDPAGNEFETIIDVTFDFEAPALLSASINRSIAGVGDNLLLQLTFDEDLAQPAALTPRGPGPLPLVNDGGGSTFEYVVSERDLSGDYAFDVTVRDLFGNAHTVDTQLLLTLDTTIPVVSNAEITPEVLAYSAQAGHRDIRFEFDASEPLHVAPAFISVFLSGTELACAPLQTPQLRYGCDYQVQAGEPSGRRLLELVGGDAAGNEVEYFANLTVDADGPELLNWLVTPEIVGLEQSATIRLTFDEFLREAPVVRAAHVDPADVANGDPPVVRLVGGEENSWLFAVDVDAANTPGTFDLEVESFDRFDNRGFQVLPPQLTVDTARLQVTRLAVEREVFSRQAPFNVVEVLIDTPENFGAEPGASLSVTVGGREATCGVRADTAPNYTCTYVVDAEAVEGSAVVEVLAVDAAGNETRRTLTRRFDFTGPALLSTSVTPARAGLDDLIALTLVANEPLMQAPALAVERNGLRIPFTHVADTEYIFEHRVGALDVPGGYDVSAVLVDEVGNESSPEIETRVRFDNTVPSVEILEVTPTRALVGAEVVATVRAVDAGEEPRTLFTRMAAALRTPDASRVMVCLPDLSPLNIAGDRYLCSVTLDGSEVPDGEEGVATIAVGVADNAGNVDEDTTTLTLDYDPPGVLAGSYGLQLTPGPGNPLRNVDAVTVGTQIRVSFVVDEPLDPTSPTLSVAPQSMAFTLNEVLSSGTLYVFDGTLQGAVDDPLIAQGPHTLSVTLVDRALNPVTVELASPAFDVDSLRPPVADTQTLGRVLYRRAPWGRFDTNGQTTLSVVGAAGAVEADAQVQFFSAEDLDSTLLGTAQADASGAFPEAVLGGADRIVVYAAVLDSAGNASAPALVRDVEWTAGLGGKVAESTIENPHRLIAVPRLRDVVPQNVLAAVEPSDVAEVAVLGEGGITEAVSYPEWQRAALTSVDLRMLGGPGTAYDPVRGVGVAFGGSDKDIVLLSSTYEWDGTSIRLVTPFGDTPSARFHPSMVFHGGLGKCVMGFGQNNYFDRGNAVLSAQLWTWDGRRWEQLSVPAGTPEPPNRSRSAMVWDPLRNRVVLFGGFGAGNANLGDTWEWDGTRWYEISTPVSPPARRNHAMVWDPNRERVILFGGSVNGAFSTDDSMWEWDGQTWREIRHPGDWPPARSQALMIYDGRLGEVILAGGEIQSGGFDTWAWDGSRWAQRSFTANINQHDEGGGWWDPISGRTIVFGGWAYAASLGTDVPGVVLAWDGDDWSDIRPTGVFPTPRMHAGFVDDPLQRGSFLFGGWGLEALNRPTFSDSWLWNGFAWTEIVDSSVAEVQDGGFYFDSVRGVTVHIGGNNNLLYEFDGTDWTQQTPAQLPPWSYSQLSTWDPVRQRGILASREPNRTDVWELDTAGVFHQIAGGRGEMAGGSSHFGAKMAFDPVRQQPIIFGGTTHGQGTFAYDGVSFTELAVDPLPVSRRIHAMATDFGRSRVLAFGGQANGVDSNDLWEWDGAHWREIAIPGVKPGARDRHMMTYDPRRQRMVMLGGDTVVGSPEETWELLLDPDLRGAFVLEARFDATGEVAADVLAVTIDGALGGVGYTVDSDVSDGAADGAAIAGAELGWWDSGQRAWVTRAQNAALPAAPERVSYTTGSAQEARRLINDGVIYAVAAPVAGIGNGSAEGDARVALDGLELRVRYRVTGSAERCDDGFDNDSDALLDCADPDCAGAANCVAEICDDGLDNDGNGLADCADTACAAQSQCITEVCDAGIDGDGDGEAGCADSECSLHAACTTACDAFLGSLLGRNIYAGTTVGGGNDVTPSCMLSNAEDRGHLWIAPADGSYVIDLQGSNYDTALSVVTGTCTGGTQIACNDDHFGTISRTVITVNAGDVVSINVDGFNAHAGNYVLSIEAQ